MLLARGNASVYPGFRDLRRRDVDARRCTERRDEVVRGEVDIDPERSATDGDDRQRRATDASRITGHARVEPNGVIVYRT